MGRWSGSVAASYGGVMTPVDVPFRAFHSAHAMVATADQLATQAGMSALDRGGNAIDAAVAANAAMTVCAPHLCGMGGDLFALVWDGSNVHALNASGRAGSNADADALRAEGHSSMPFRHHPAAVTVPGCVDGWLALHERFGELALADVLAPAIRLAAIGFAASPLLVGSVRLLDDRGRAQMRELAEQAVTPGVVVQRPGAARALRAIVDKGRDGYYGGEFGAGLVGVAGGLLTEDDVIAPHADWVTPLTTTVFGVGLHTIPPNSQGYLTLGSARVAEHAGVPDDPADDHWAHLLIEASVVAGHDRPDVLHDGADGAKLLAAIMRRAGMVDPERASGRPAPTAEGDTTYLCTADSGGRAVSLIQSNASGFGSWLVEPGTGINLQNRGLGFSLVPGHPAEYAPGRRPPHTLCPALATDAFGLRSVLGTMGGDAQPQVLLQVAARLFVHDEGVANAVAAPRWTLRGPSTGFDTWDNGPPATVAVEGHAPEGWTSGLGARGYDVRQSDAFSSQFGHAHAIVVTEHGYAGAADPRSIVGSVAGR
jgi:gamma-glutamyltranspeptidase/glutathione hydrolase